jgi:hypothetical protein
MAIAKKKTTPPTSKQELLERFKDYPGIKAFERALESPDGPGSLPILLKGDPENACRSSGHQDMSLGEKHCKKCGKPNRFWYVRHVNTKQKGRVAAIKFLAMVPVEIAELKNPEEIADLVKDSADGLVHTGTNGVIVLYKIPLELRNKRARAKREALKRRASNPNKVRDDLANDAGRALGSEAADMFHQGLEYSEKTIRTSFGEEMGGTNDD